jgi:hypothetical protein
VKRRICAALFALLALVPAVAGAGGNLPQYQPFVGRWYFQGGPIITVNADGTATAIWRTYHACGVPAFDPVAEARPCEDAVDGIYGGVAQILLTGIDGSLAHGKVQSSSDPAGFLKAGDDVQLALLTDGRMLVSGGKINPGLPVCGSNVGLTLGPTPCGV